MKTLRTTALAILALFTLSLGTALTPSVGAAADASKVNTDDVTYTRDTERITSDQTKMQGAVLAPGIECPDGACFGKSPNEPGFSTTPLVEPSAPAPQQPGSTGTTVKK